METKPIDAAKLTEAERAEPEPLEDEYIIRRPKRATLTAEESIRRTEEFIAKGKDRFIASIRKSKG